MVVVFVFLTPLDVLVTVVLVVVLVFTTFVFGVVLTFLPWQPVNEIMLIKANIRNNDRIRFIHPPSILDPL